MVVKPNNFGHVPGCRGIAVRQEDKARGALTGAMVHEQERSGAAWTLEWMVLPPLALSAARALGLAIELVEGLEISDSQG